MIRKTRVIKENENYSREEERKLFEEYNKTHDHELKNKIAERNLKLIYKVINAYSVSIDHIEREDLVQEGFIGLYRAIDMYDINQGNKFSTYAYHWISHYVRAFLYEKKLIHIPRHFTITLGNVLKFQHEFFQQTGKNPELEDYMEGLNLTQDKALMAVGCLSGYVSLDKQLRDGDDETTVMDLLDSKEDISEECGFRYDMEGLRSAMREILKERELEVLEYRFGFVTGKPNTLEEIGKMQNCTKERIRQIEKNALRKLQRSGKIQQYKELI